MRGLTVGVVTSLSLAALMSGVDVRVGAQGPAPAARRSTPALPRTPEGKPDLQGIFDFSTATPLQRPAAFADKTHFTEAEAEAFERQVAANRDNAEERDSAPLPAGQVGGYNQFWYEFGTKIVPDREDVTDCRSAQRSVAAADTSRSGAVERTSRAVAPQRGRTRTTRRIRALPVGL